MKNQIILLFIAISFPLIFISCSKKSEEVHPYTIGQNYGGGIIFYIDASWHHGLICAPNDQVRGIAWQLEPFTLTNVKETAIGKGSTNTTSLVSILGQGDYAAKLCDDLVLSGYSDWYLPSKDELNIMYSNLASLSIGNFDMGMGNYYWSSSEVDIFLVWGVSFYSLGGGKWVLSKLGGCNVRAVRTF